MKSTIFRRLARIAATASFAAALGCATSQSLWDGTVDAGFGYRTAERQTVVRALPPGSYSERAGLRVGDIVVAVDGVEISNATADEVIAAMRGPTGSFAKLSVLRGGEVVEVAVERLPRAKKDRQQGSSNSQ